MSAIESLERGNRSPALFPNGKVVLSVFYFHITQVPAFFRQVDLTVNHNHQDNYRPDNGRIDSGM